MTTAACAAEQPAPLEAALAAALPGTVGLKRGSPNVVFSRPEVASILSKGDLVVFPNAAPRTVFALLDRVGPDGRAALAHPKTMEPVPFDGPDTDDVCVRPSIAFELEMTEDLTSLNAVAIAVGLSRTTVHGVVKGTGLQGSRLVAEMRRDKLTQLRLLAIARAESKKTEAAKP